MKIFNIRQSLSGIVYLIIFLEILLAFTLYDIVVNYNAHAMYSTMIRDWIGLVVTIAVWCFFIILLFITLKSELKKLFNLNKSFYIMLLPLIILTLGIFGLIWSIKCNIKRSILDRGKISVSHKK